MYRKADGSSMGSESYLLGVLPGIGLVLVREVGGLIRRRRVESQFMVFSDVPGIAYVADDREFGRGWGEFAAQGVVPGGEPAMRIGWTWSHGAPESHRQPESARRERDRVLHWLPR
jgi:hypothetical protein